MGALAAYRRVLGNSRLTRLLAGEFVSSIGDWLYLVALLIVVYDVTRDPVILGLMGAGRIVPFLVLAVPAGIVADRFDRRLIMLATDIVRGVLQVVLAGLVLVGAPTISIVVVAIVAACASAFFGPAIGSYLPSLIDDEADLGPANSVWATLDDLAFFVGPAVAGILIASGGLALAFLLNAVSFGIVGVVLWSLPSRGRPTAGADADDGGDGPVKVGWGDILRRIPGIVALNAATAFVGAGLGVLTVVVAFESLGAGEEVTGFLNAATGIGGIIAGFGAGWVLLRRLDAPIVAATVISGVGLGVLGITREVPVALLAIGIVAGGLLLLDVISDTVLQRAVPDMIRGRALGLLQVSNSAAMISGSFLAPVMAAAWGIPTAFFVMGGAATIVSVIAVAILRPSGALMPPAVRERPLELLLGSVFGGLPPARLEAAGRALVRVPVRAGERVIEQGAPADRFYFVDRGTFRVTQRDDGPAGTEHDLGTMGPGEVFGEIGLLRSAPRTASVTAETDGALYALELDGFLDLVSAEQGLGTRLLDLHRVRASGRPPR